MFTFTLLSRKLSQPFSSSLIELRIYCIIFFIGSWVLKAKNGLHAFFPHFGFVSTNNYCHYFFILIPYFKYQVQQLYWCRNSFCFYLVNFFLLENVFFSDCYHLLAKHLPEWISVVMLMFILEFTALKAVSHLASPSPATVEMHMHEITV